MTNLASAALAYARAGLLVFPLAPNAKEPAIEGGRGVYDATNDQAIVRSWWRQWPSANIGLAVKAEWLVIDVDVRSGGPATVDEWLTSRGLREMPTTPTQFTATGGAHYVFARPSCDVKGKAGKGVDVLGLGRYIVAAPSLIAGKRYEWTKRLSTTPIATLPPWLHALVARPVLEPSKASPQPRASVDVIERARKYVAKCPPAISGSGGHTQTFLVAQFLVRGFALDDASAFALMKEWNANCCPPWRDYDLKRKIAQARTRGSVVVGSLRDAQRRSA